MNDDYVRVRMPKVLKKSIPLVHIRLTHIVGPVPRTGLL